MTVTEGSTRQYDTSLTSLERILASRTRSRPQTNPQGWEREMVRGYVYNFDDEYRLSITNHLGDKGTIVIEEDAAMIATRVWDSSVLTVKWIEQICQDVSTGGIDLLQAFALRNLSSIQVEKPIQVLELGAGTGLLSIGLAKMGAAVLSTEYGLAVKHLQYGCRKNHVLVEDDDTLNGPTLLPGKVRCQELDWFKETNTLESLFQDGERAFFDLIAVTDCSLTERDTEGVFAMIDKYSTKGQTSVVMGVCLEREGTPLAIRKAERYPDYRYMGPTQQHPEYSSTRLAIMTFNT